MCGYGEAPQVWWISEPKANKEHICCECGSTITIGETYHLFKAVYDYGFDQFKTCSICEKIRNRAMKHIDIEELVFGCLYETIGSDYEIEE